MVLLLLIHLIASPPEAVTRANHVMQSYFTAKSSRASFQPNLQTVGDDFIVRYQVRFDDLPVWNAPSGWVWLDKRLQLVKSQPLPLYQTRIQATVSSEMSKQKAFELIAAQVPRTQNCQIEAIALGLYGYGSQVRDVYRFTLTATLDGMPMRYQVDVDACSGRPLDWSPLHYSFESSGRVYRHNPIAATGDASIRSDAETAMVTVELQGLNGSGKLVGSYVDVTAPGIPAPEFRPGRDYVPGMARSQQGQFFYAPERPEFEEVMVYYWVDTAQRFLQHLNFKIWDRPIAVHCHYFTGTNAFFSVIDQALHFGDGPVDSAEDASVITHEYGHAILSEIVGARFQSAAGSMFHEGFADYFSFAVSRWAEPEVGPDLFPEYLGEWYNRTDGHEPPHLRTLLPPEQPWPQLSYEPHRDGQLWSSAFYELDRKLPPHTFMTLLLRALFLADGPMPRDLEKALRAVDERDFEGRYTQSIQAVLRKRGLWEPEKTLNIVDLAVGETLLDPGYHWLRIRPEPAMIALQIVAQLRQGGVYRLLLKEGELPTEFDTQKAYWGQEPKTWLLDQQTSWPRLDPSRVYYLGVETTAAVTIALNSVESEAPALLHATEPWVLDLPENTSAVAVIQIGSSAQQVIFTNEAGVEAPLWITLSLDRAIRFEDRASTENAISFLMVDEFILEVPAFMRGRTLFITASSYQPFPVNTRLTWEERTAPLVELRPGSEVSGLFDPSGRASIAFALDQNPRNILIQADTPSPFQLELPDGQFMPSSAMAGLQTVLLQRGSNEFIGWRGIVMANGLPSGAYRLHLKGASGASYHVSTKVDGDLDFPVIETDSTSQFTLPPNSLLPVFLRVPANAYDFRLLFDKTQRPIRYNFLLADGSATRFINAAGFELGAIQQAFRQPIVSMALNPGVLTPGTDYQLWLLNENDVDVSVRFKFEIQTREPEGQLLSDDMLVEQDWSADTLYGASFWAVPLDIEPNPSTKRICLSFQNLSGNDQAAVALPQADGSWRLLAPSTMCLDESVLGFVPNRPFRFYFFSSKYLGYKPGSSLWRITKREDLQEYDHVFTASETVAWEIQGSAPFQAKIEWSDWVRGLDLAFEADPATSGRRLFLQMEYDRRIGPIATYELTFENGEGHLSLEAGSDLLPFRGQALNLRLFSVDSNHTPGTPLYEGPLPVRVGVRYHSLQSEATIAAVPPAIADLATGRVLKVINPYDREQTFELDGQSFLLPPMGSFSLDVPDDGSHCLNFAEPLTLFEQIDGPSWSTLRSLSPYSRDHLLVPHIPSLTSQWTSFLAAVKGGSVPAVLSGDELGTNVLISGDATLELRGQGTTPTIGTIVSDRALGELFPNADLAAAQYWTRDSFAAAETLSHRARQTLYLPHVPNLEQWWLGLALINPGDTSTRVKVLAYNHEGQLLDRIGELELAPGSERVGLLDNFTPVPPAEVAWLSFQSDGEPIQGLAFIGALANGKDVGCYAMSEWSSEAVLLPGKSGESWYGIALLNPLNHTVSYKIEAIDPAGQVMASYEATLPPRKKATLVGSALFAQVTSSYYLRIHADQGRLCAIQLQGDTLGSLALQTGIPAPWPHRD